MQQAEWKQLNNIPETSAYIEFPLAFTGKSKNGKPSAFAGLLLSTQFILAVIHTMNKIYREPAKLTYEYFVQNFGMSKETVSKALETLLQRDIIERVKQSRYKIKASYYKKDYVEIDVYWFKHEWALADKTKRLTYSRLLILAVLKRGCTNPKTNGEFVSSQYRIGKAANLPRTTAGDSVRELLTVSTINYVKKGGNDKRKRGCSLFTVNPQLLEVKHPHLNIKSVKPMFYVTKREQTADEVHTRLMLDAEYKNITERIFNNYKALTREILNAFGRQTPEIEKLESETQRLQEEIKAYYHNHKIKIEILPPEYFDIFPPGFFKAITTQSIAI